MPEDFSAIMDEIDADDQVQDETVATLESPAVEDTQTEPIVEPVSKAQTAEDDRKLPKYIRNIKESDPEGYVKARADFFTRLEYSQQFANVDEAKSVKAFVAEHGGLEGAQAAFTDLQGKAQELDSIQERLVSDPVSLITEMPPESVTALAPAMLTEWAKNDFAGYNAQLSGIFAQTIAQAGIPLDLERADIHMELLKDAIIASGQQENPAIVRAFTALTQQLGKFKDFAGSYSKVSANPQQAKPNANLDAREQSVAQRETAQRAEQFDRQVETFKVPFIDAELKTYFDRAPGDTEKQDAARQMVRARVTEALKQELQEKGKNSTAEQVRAHVQRGKLEDAFRIAKTRETLLIQQIAPKVGRIIYGQPAAAKVEAAPVARQQARSAPQVATPRSRVNSFNSVWDE